MKKRVPSNNGKKWTNLYNHGIYQNDQDINSNITETQTKLPKTQYM